MIRVTYVLGCHEHRYTQHFKALTIDQAQQLVNERMAKAYFNLEVTGGYIRIYPRKVSAIEVRDITHDQRAQNAAKEGEN